MYTWFRKGKAAVTSGSDIVRFTGATLTTDPTKPVVGDAFTIDGISLYEIVVIDSDNTGEFIKLQKPYAAATNSNVNYAIIRLASSTQNNKLVAMAAAAINQKQISLDDMYEWYTSEADTVDFLGPDDTIVTLKTYHKLTQEISDVGGNAGAITIVATNIDKVVDVSNNMSSVIAATTSATQAASSAASALASKNAAASSETSAASSASAALASKNAAASSATAAASSASAALASKNAAESSATAAASSSSSALTSKNAAATSEANALTSKNAAASSATAAATSATNAANSATAALDSKNAAATSETNAASSAASALASKNAASTSETNALSSKNSAATSATNAANSATAALASKNAAATSETNAASSASSALASKNAAAISETNAAASAFQSFAMSQAQFEAIRAQNNEKYAASGFVHFGKNIDGGVQVPINQGLFTRVASPTENSLFLGRIYQDAVGSSKTNHSVLTIAGVQFDLIRIGETFNGTMGAQIKFPQAPDGKTTYNKSTGVVTKHGSVTAAFNAQAADPTNVEVVTDRVDMWGFEAFLEEVNTTNPYVYPNGLIQSQAATMDGITTSASNRPVTYYAVFDGDTGSKGKGVNFFTLTDAQKKKVLGNHKNNLYYLDDGRLVQWRLRQRTIAGAGNRDWEMLQTAIPSAILYSGANGYLRLQGKLDSIAAQFGNDDGTIAYSQGAPNNPDYARGGLGLNGARSPLLSDGAECYFLVCGTVNRLNQGAYHPSFNPSGAALFTGGNPWHIADVPNTLFCFTNNVLGSLSSGYSGRPDIGGRYYDAIYASGFGGVCRDMRYLANGVDLVDFAEADQRVKNGTYRGFEFGRITKVISFVTSSSETASNYGRVPMTRAEALRVCELIGVSTTGVIFFDQAKMAVSLYNPNNGMVIHSSAIGAVQENSHFGTYLDPANPYAIWLGFDQKVVENNLSGNQVLTIAGETGSANSNIFCSSGQTLYAIVTTLDKVSVGGSFMQTDVIGNPANILATPALANGWQGSWVHDIPDGAKRSPLTRKNLNSGSVILLTYTGDNGATWSNLNYGFSPITNDTNAVGLNLVCMFQYQAFAKQTENAVSNPVYSGSSGVGAVAVTGGFLPSYGVLWMESLVQKVATGGANIAHNVTMKSYGFFSGGKLLVDADYPIAHNQINIAASNNSSPSVKALNYNVNINQQANIQYAYTELKHNGTSWGDDGKVAIVDNQSTKTDLNGNTVLVGTAKLKEPIGWIKNKV